MHAAVARECRATRASLGIFDASTLGKIEVVGPDAVTFMERMYTNPWAKLGVGRCRYGLLLGEDGFIRDDGVIGRLAADRFHVTTTTGGAARVLNMMEDYLQTEWPDLKVWLTSTTEQWATDRPQRPERPQAARAVRRGPRHLRRQPSRTWRSPNARSPASRPGSSASPSPASSASRSTSPPATAAPSGRSSARPASSTTSAPTAPRPCTCCAPRRATSSSARTPTAR